MSSSSVPQLQFTAAGVVIPTEAEILAGAIADIDAAFGGGLNPALNTPQGQIASSITAAIGDKNAEIAYMVNQFDPRYAAGRFQDAIAQIYFLQRKPAIATRVMCTMTGLDGLVVPAGLLAADTNGNIYRLTETIFFGGGNTTGQGYFDNVETGPIPCAAGTLNRIYTALGGLDAITNVADGVLGRDVESRQDFEYRRYNSVALNSHGGIDAVRAAVADVAGVIDVFVYENATGTDDPNVGSTLVDVLKNSIYVCAQGGSDADIAYAIWKKKGSGCNTNGSTSIVVSDTAYTPPYPTYTIKFQRPTAIPIKFSVQIAASSLLPTYLTDQIKAAIVARFNGADELGQRERIGGAIFVDRYFDAIAIGGARILSILIGPSTTTLTVMQIGIDQLPTITESDITVTYV